MSTREEQMKIKEAADARRQLGKENKRENEKRKQKNIRGSRTDKYDTNFVQHDHDL